MKLTVLVCYVLLLCGYTTTSAQQVAHVKRTGAKTTHVPDSVSYSNTIGPIVIRYMTFNKGYYLNCSLYVASQMVGLKTMTDRDEVYIFDIVIGAYSVKGTLSALFMPPGQYSTLSGDLFFANDVLTSDSTRYYQQYKGLIGGWTTTP